MEQQSGRKLTPTVSKTRTSDGKIQECKIASEIHRSTRFNPQPFQSGTQSLKSPILQEQPICRFGRIAANCSLRVANIELSSYADFCSDNANFLSLPANFTIQIAQCRVSIIHKFIGFNCNFHCTVFPLFIRIKCDSEIFQFVPVGHKRL